MQLPATFDTTQRVNLGMAPYGAPAILRNCKSLEMMSLQVSALECLAAEL